MAHGVGVAEPDVDDVTVRKRALEVAGIGGDVDAGVPGPSVGGAQSPGRTVSVPVMPASACPGNEHRIG